MTLYHSRTQESTDACGRMRHTLLELEIKG